MSCSCQHCRHKKNDSRDGAGQRNRLLAALEPGNAPLDDRNLEDLLAQVNAYAAKVRFFPLPDEGNGTIISWQALLERDLSVVLASIVLEDPSEQEQRYNSLRSQLYDDPTEKNLALLFGPIDSLRLQFERWYERTNNEATLHPELSLIARSNLAPQLRKAISIIQTHGNPADLPNLNMKKEGLWGFDITVLPDALPPFSGTDENDPATEEIHPLVEASFYIDDVFQAFYQATLDIISQSHERLDYSLRQYPEHQPHLALLIAFLEIFKYLQHDLNDVTRRHLDFFYRDVLHLSERPAIPDQVHVIFELAKGVSDYVVEFGTPLLAGEEPGTGREILYRTGENDSTEPAAAAINRTSVKEIKNVYLELNPETKTNPVDFHANAVARSADGNGAAFPIPDSSFDTFGVGGRDEETALTLCNFTQNAGYFLNKARIGFAIATPQLLLAGGLRKITLKINGLSKILQKAKAEQIGRILEIWLSSENGWLPFRYIKGTPASEDDLYFIKGTGDTLELTISVSAPKIVPFDPALHPGDVFPTRSPVMKVILRNLDKEHFDLPLPIYDQLVIDKEFSLQTKVGDDQAANGLKDLFIQNSIQNLENGKTFFAFTQLPGNGFPLYVGAPEFFSKPQAGFKVFMQWAPQAVPPALRLDLLKNKSWATSIPQTPDLTNGVTTITGTTSLPRSFSLKKEQYDTNSENGFFRVIPSGITATTVEGRAAAGVQQQAEYISITYDSTLAFDDLETGVDQFFHLYPFGFVPIFPARNFGQLLDMQSLSKGLFVNAQVPGSELNPAWFLFPQFRFGAPADRVLLPNESHQYNQAALQTGHLFIGLENLRPQQNLSLLFKFEEGTQADDDGTPPAVHWSYLIDNKWRPLPGDAILNDGTYGLQTTGIMLFSIPKDIHASNTLLPAGQCWLCASVSNNPDRMPRLINILAQAVTATFDDQGIGAQHYEAAFPAGQISNLKFPVDKVKAVTQPYESFGGRAADNRNTFFVEASERIRHKGRAVHIWDYEHLVLSNFPSVYKVKAIPVSDPDCNCRKPDTNPCATDPTHPQPSSCMETAAPGYVMVVPVPDFRRRVGGNRLQPKNSNRVLKEIEKYLSRRTSPFVTVRAKNPKYEEVLVSFSVQFREGIDKGVFLRRLNDELVQYLTPWAFEESAEVRFDGRVYASDVINFIEERPYVDFIVDFRMFHCKDDCCGQQDEFLKEVRGKIIQEGTEDTLSDTLIQVMGTVLQIASDENGDFRVLLADGDRILITKEGYGTRIFRYEKTGAGKLIDELDDQELAVSNDMKIGLTKLDDAVQTVEKNTLLSVVKDGFKSIPGTVSDIDDANISILNMDGTAAANAIPLNTSLIIQSADYTDKPVILGKILTANATIFLYPKQVPLSLKIVIAGSTTQEIIREARIQDLQNENKRAVKTDTPGLYQIDQVEQGHFLLVSAPGFIPKAVAITEHLVRGLGATDARPLTIALLPDCQHALGNTDEMIEFWENVMSEYYPEARGIQIGIRPCNEQSILVSAVQHMIQVYEPKPVPDPCASPVAPVKDTGTPTGGNQGITVVKGDYQVQTAYSMNQNAFNQFLQTNRSLKSIQYIAHSWGTADAAAVLGLQYAINPNLLISNPPGSTVFTGISAMINPDIQNLFSLPSITFNSF